MLTALHGEGPLDPARFGLKAAFLRDAAALGCRVPPGFVVPAGQGVDRSLLSLSLAELEERCGSRLGDVASPLLVSVRSSGPRSLPGELETLLGVGAGRTTLPALAARFGDETRARAFVVEHLRGWRRVVRGVRAPTMAPGRAGVTVPPPAQLERELDELERLAEIPADPLDALVAAVDAVARIGRERSGAPIGVLVMAMRLGAGVERSGAAVVLSRHALTGEPGPTGEWTPSMASVSLTSGRVVSPPPVAASGPRGGESLERAMPEVFAEIDGWARALERAHRDAVELEVTIERGEPHLLQVRPSRLGPRALVRVAVAFVEAGVWTRAEALSRVPVEAVRASGVTSLPPEAEAAVVATGLPASPGVASGTVSVRLEPATAADGPVVLFRPDASPEDAPAIRAAAAVVTASGGLTSHAAVMSRALGRPCVVSASGVAVRGSTVTVTGGALAIGEWVTVDGATGRVLRGRHEARWTAELPEAETLLAWHAEPR